MHARRAGGGPRAEPGARTRRETRRTRGGEIAPARFVSERLSESHRLDRLHSGNVELDRWLLENALAARSRRTAQTFVWHTGDGAALAYYSLTAHLLQRDELPHRLGRGGPRQIPAVLLARLALDDSLHGQGLGGALLADALGRVVTATETVAARFVVVDAIDERAAAFYEHHGFRPITQTRRLVQRLRDTAAALA